MKKYRFLVFAGTFDHFHLGHKKMLDLAFSLSSKVALGITTEKLSQKKFLSQTIEDFSLRKKMVEDYLKKKNWLNRAVFYPLSDIYGPAKIKKEFDAILVSKKTLPNAAKINQIRTKLGLPKLKIIVGSDVFADDGKIISSERIRAGEIDREGHNFQLSVFNFQKKQLILPFYLRSELRKPLGKVILGDESQQKTTAKKLLQLINQLKQPMVISVGDFITHSLLKIGFDPDIKIIDFKVKRKDFSHHWQSIFPQFKFNFKSNNFDAAALKLYLNHSGTINIKTALFLSNLIKRTLKNKKEKPFFLINGEEDLLALPAILFAPLRSLVLYGQMGLGVIVVEVTEERKREVKETLRKFI